MKKNVLVFGLIAGGIVSAFMAATVRACADSSDFVGNMLLGYAAMLVAFSFVFIGIKNYRDKYNGGLITFGKAFQIGLFISLIASTLYVITWMFLFHFYIPDFTERYADHVLKQAQTAGASASEMQAKTAEMERFKEMYKNPLMVILFTYLEILPVGLLVTLISALILKRKVVKDSSVTA